METRIILKYFELNEGFHVLENYWDYKNEKLSKILKRIMEKHYPGDPEDMS